MVIKTAEDWKKVEKCLQDERVVKLYCDKHKVKLIVSLADWKIRIYPMVNKIIHLEDAQWTEIPTKTSDWKKHTTMDLKKAKFLERFYCKRIGHKYKNVDRLRRNLSKKEFKQRGLGAYIVCFDGFLTFSTLKRQYAKNFKRIEFEQPINYSYLFAQDEDWTEGE